MDYIKYNPFHPPANQKTYYNKWQGDHNITGGGDYSYGHTFGDQGFVQNLNFDDENWNVAHYDNIHQETEYRVHTPFFSYRNVRSPHVRDAPKTGRLSGTRNNLHHEQRLPWFSMQFLEN